MKNIASGKGISVAVGAGFGVAAVIRIIRMRNARDGFHEAYSDCAEDLSAAETALERMGPRLEEAVVRIEQLLLFIDHSNLDPTSLLDGKGEIDNARAFIDLYRKHWAVV